MAYSMKLAKYIGKLGIATKQKCGSCYRYHAPIEKLLPNGKTPPTCTNVDQCGYADVITADHICGKWYYPRWLIAFGQRVDQAKKASRWWWNRRVRQPINSRRQPVAIEWQDSYNCYTDSIEKDRYPLCPRCGEMPYSVEQCVFCGQRFIREESKCAD
jgi:hypothetical protein